MKQVILVEHDEPIRDTFRIVFDESNFEIIDLENGEKILNRQIDAPALFILDMNISDAGD